MGRRGGLKPEIWRCVIVLFFSLLIGLMFGKPWLFLALSGCLYLAWLFFSIYQLSSWIQSISTEGAIKEDLTGVWANIGYNLHRIFIRHEKEKQRLQMVVNRVQDMTSALTDAVVLIDPRGNMEWWNTAAEQLFNFKEVDRGHKLTNLVRHPSFVNYFEQRDYQNPLELTTWRKNRHMEIQVHAFGLGERLVIARDITRLFKLEQMRKDFVANVSHELRTPLTVIRGYIETLADSPNVPPAWTKALVQMEQQGKRMTSLINDLIALSRLETEELDQSVDTIPVQELIAGIIDDAEALSIEKRHGFVVEGDQDLAIIGNRGELRSAISNLVVNALNYSKPDTDISITYRFDEKGAFISVKDQGIGIDPKHIPRLTERFYRVDASRSVAAGGTGLGLAIVKHVLLRHNCGLKIESKLGFGSTFTCVIPDGIARRISPKSESPQ